MTVGSGCIKKIGQLELKLTRKFLDNELTNLFYTATAHDHIMVVLLSLTRICPVNLNSS
jgi:hypothetical protein